MGVEKVISYCKKVCSIPRASGDEQAISDYIVSFAKERGLEVSRDSIHNIIIRKPGNIKGSRPVILQGHLDMVYVKEEGCSHRYEDGIEVKEDDYYYFADGKMCIRDRYITALSTRTVKRRSIVQNYCAPVLRYCWNCCRMRENWRRW